MCKYAQVIINYAKVKEIDMFFTYTIGKDLIHKVKIGHRVLVPFGKSNKPQIGYVLDILETKPEVNYPLKEIIDIVDNQPIISSIQLDMIWFLVNYYGATYAASIDTVLPPGVLNTPFNEDINKKEFVKLALDEMSVTALIEENKNKKSFEARRRILEYMLIHKKALKKDLIDKLGFSQSAVQTLCKNNILKKELDSIKVEKDPINYSKFKALNEDQLKAKESIVQNIEKGTYKTFLLEGVTGSGKTEVFLYAIKHVLEQGGSVIVLVPEIALTKQTLDRFRERFGNNVALTHSRMTPKERQSLYIKAKSKEVSVIIGPRSAVFMPLEDLKLIIVDEEHDTSYKSETMPKYHAVEVAKMRMKKQNGTLILASATPSLESYYHARRKEYTKLILPKRIGKSRLPNISVVDMREELKKGNGTVISTKLFELMEKTLKAKKQVMLLINRRGHSTFINCRSCGFVVKCKHCDVALTYHLSNNSLVCHHCGMSVSIPDKCPECGSGYIRFFGSGTEKIQQLLHQYFSDYGIGRMDLDTTSGKEGHNKILQKFISKEYNILIGTQMIAKGHDFPDVTLVGILSADMSLYLEDFRCNEKTFQLLTQALGRAGRGEDRGEVVIQTYNPEHPVLQMVKNFSQQQFYEEELAFRKLKMYPPYTHIFSVLVTGKREENVIKAAQVLAQYYKLYAQKASVWFKIIGPTPAVISKVADHYRWKIIIVGEDREKLLVFGQYCMEKFKTKEKSEEVNFNWDIDPITMI